MGAQGWTYVAAAAAGFIFGVILMAFVHGRRLRRQARFLRERRPQSSSRVCAPAPTRAWKELAEAQNGQIDAIQDRAVEELRSQQALRRDLMALVHDLRTPLAAARGYVQLAQARLSDGRGTGDALGYLGSSIGRLDAGEALVAQLAVYLQANDPDRTYDLQEVRILSTLADVLDSHAEDLARRGWDPSLVFEDEGLTVMADSAALHRILDNLVSNALRYGAGELGFVQQGNHVAWELSVSNQLAEGSEIDPAHVFDRFWRADPARGGSGMGLGLSIARSLAADLGFSLACTVRGGVVTFALSGVSTSQA